MKQLLIRLAFAVLLGACQPGAARAAESSGIVNPEAPVVFINLMEISPQDIDRFVEDWNERSKIMGQMPGYITATLYRSLLADARYQIINVAQWQSYDAWRDAFNHPAYAQRISEDLGHAASVKLERGFYRPAAWSVNEYAGTFPGDDRQPVTLEGAPLERAPRNAEIKSPESPFVFINLMQMRAEDVGPFVADWRRRSKIMGQMPAAIGSTLYRSVLPDSAFQIVNVSQWQSYNGFMEAINDSTYARELTSDLEHTPSIKLTRGFYRQVATYTHVYPGFAE